MMVRGGAGLFLLAFYIITHFTYEDNDPNAFNWTPIVIIASNFTVFFVERMGRAERPRHPDPNPASRLLVLRVAFKPPYLSSNPKPSGPSCVHRRGRRTCRRSSGTSWQRATLTPGHLRPIRPPRNRARSGQFGSWSPWGEARGMNEASPTCDGCKCPTGWLQNVRIRTAAVLYQRQRAKPCS